MKRADEMTRRFKNYKIPVTRIKGGSPKEAVEIVERLNSRGVDITRDQMAGAFGDKKVGVEPFDTNADEFKDEPDIDTE